MSATKSFNIGDLVYYVDNGISDTGLVQYVDPDPNERYPVYVLFSDGTEDQYALDQLGSFRAPDTP